MAKLNKIPFVESVAITIGVIYVICATAIYLFKESAVRFFNYFFHGIDLSKIAVINFSWPSFFLGLIITLIATAIISLIFVLVYNKCYEHCKKRDWLEVER